MQVNQNGDPINEDIIFDEHDFGDEYEVSRAVILLAEHLGMIFVRTNATKHGNTELVLRAASHD